jgi:hypothetical protein
MLFVNPRGWQPPILGRPSPSINWGTVTNFPLFPLALSQGVPFQLVNGYMLGGAPETARTSLALCEGLELIQKDLPRKGYEKAAKDLIQSEAFKSLYADAAEAETMALRIRQAAKGTNRWKKE